MNEKEILKKAFEDVIWAAIRYAHGRHTYAPDMVRDAVRDFQKVFPEWKPKRDITIEPPEKLRSPVLRLDYLDDLFKE